MSAKSRCKASITTFTYVGSAAVNSTTSKCNRQKRKKECKCGRYLIDIIVSVEVFSELLRSVSVFVCAADSVLSTGYRGLGLSVTLGPLQAATRAECLLLRECLCVEEDVVLAVLTVVVVVVVVVKDNSERDGKCNE